MNKIVFKWHEGKAGALTTSRDDGTIYDKPLIDILNENKIKGTFDLNSKLFENQSLNKTFYCTYVIPQP